MGTRAPVASPGVEGTEPPAAFFDELGAAFRRLRPQGSHRWNFGGAFRQLETVVKRGAALAGTGAEAGAAAEGRRGSALSQLDRAVARAVAGRLDEAARRVVRQTVGPPLADVHEALDATMEALRFLSARIDAIEDASARHREPVDGMAWLVPPPDLGPWTDRVVGWLASTAGTEVVVGETGDGGLPRALASAGLRVRAAEPRGAMAWASAADGVAVHVGPVVELLAAQPSDSVGGLVLAGVVDRSPVEELVDLLVTARDRLAPGAPVVVIGTAPTAWGPVARDLLPGRPLHPATWSLLLGRHGFGDIETSATEPTVSFAVRAVRAGR